MLKTIQSFLQNDRGAITVDYAVLSAAALSMAIATTDALRATIGTVSSNLEAQLRTQQISDAFVAFTSSHFDPLYDAGSLTEENAETVFGYANELTNQEVLSALGDYIGKMTDGSITSQELASAYAVMSVAHQRNIVGDDVISTYFGVDPSITGPSGDAGNTPPGDGDNSGSDNSSDGGGDSNGGGDSDSSGGSNSSGGGFGFGFSF